MNILLLIIVGLIGALVLIASLRGEPQQDWKEYLNRNVIYRKRSRAQMFMSIFDEIASPNTKPRIKIKKGFVEEVSEEGKYVKLRGEDWEETKNLKILDRAGR